MTWPAIGLALLLGFSPVVAGAREQRVDLSRQYLMDPTAAPVLVAMAAFAPEGGTGGRLTDKDPRRFEGTLTLSDGRQDIRAIYEDDTVNSYPLSAWQHLPDFAYDLVQIGDTLLPLRRGPQQSDHAAAEFILEPGQVWVEPGDDGAARAALPFSLKERNQNCVHNGVLSFLIDADSGVSQAAYEIASETCRYLKFDAWGLLEARYQPHAVAGASEAARAWTEETAHRLPMRPIAALAVDHAPADPGHFGSAADVAASDLTVFGVVVDGIHYGGGCETRHGTYPYCDVLDLPSYSLAKGLVGGLALMRRELLFPGTAARTVPALVPACKDAGWDDVTLAHLADMTSGHARDEGIEADEDSGAMTPFFAAEDHETKLGVACSSFPRRAAPGSAMHYRTSDTYILGSALSALIGSDFYRTLLVEPIWHRLGLSPVLDWTERTRDGVAQPFTGYGLILHRDDIARLALFLARDGGRIDGTAAIDPGMLAAVLQKDPATPGTTVRWADGAELRYKSGFWAENVGALIGCTTPVWAPYLSGYGGITVAMMPNGVIYYVFSDGGSLKWSAATREDDRIHPLCPRDARALSKDAPQ